MDGAKAENPKIQIAKNGAYLRDIHLRRKEPWRQRRKERDQGISEQSARKVNEQEVIDPLSMVGKPKRRHTKYSHSIHQEVAEFQVAGHQDARAFDRRPQVLFCQHHVVPSQPVRLEMAWVSGGCEPIQFTKRDEKDCDGKPIARPTDRVARNAWFKPRHGGDNSEDDDGLKKRLYTQ